MKKVLFLSMMLTLFLHIGYLAYFYFFTVQPATTYQPVLEEDAILLEQSTVLVSHGSDDSVRAFLTVQFIRSIPVTFLLLFGALTLVRRFRLRHTV
ncbi:hypothetical protein [Exiguobacterium sp. S90]|uniref:hypothetical protein n=1 Tax=Exiguobacterium sp. S90 TaxID=1221231 RepID=UPI001BEC8AD0|nr:hypothetical protein [Exiguobacterium sp. S90]